jgi:hypothetical protein
MSENRKCYGCKFLSSEWLGDGSTTFKCGRVRGLVLGYVGAFDNDEPHEANDCYTRETARMPGKE